MIGHLGSRVSALLDGRMSAAEEEKAWEHVHACHFCRDLVEREGWVKTQLAGLTPTACSVSDSLKSNLRAACAAPVAPDPSFLARHRGVVLWGSSAASVAFVGVAALSGVLTTAPGTDRRPNLTKIDQPISRSTPGNAPAQGTPAGNRRSPGAVATATPSAPARPVSTLTPSAVAPSATTSSTPSGLPTAQARPVATATTARPSATPTETPVPGSPSGAASTAASSAPTSATASPGQENSSR